MVKIWTDDSGLHVQTDCPTLLRKNGITWWTSKGIESFKRSERRKHLGMILGFSRRFDEYPSYQDTKEEWKGYEYWDSKIRRIKKDFPESVQETLKKIRALPGQEHESFYDTIWTVGGGACITVCYSDEGWLYYFTIGAWDKDGNLIPPR